MIPVDKNIAVYDGAQVDIEFVFDSVPTQDYVLRIYSDFNRTHDRDLTLSYDGVVASVTLDAANFDYRLPYRYELRKLGAIPVLRGIVLYETAWSSGQIDKPQTVTVPVLIPDGVLLFGSNELLFDSDNLIFS